MHELRLECPVNVVIDLLRALNPVIIDLTPLCVYRGFDLRLLLNDKSLSLLLQLKAKVFLFAFVLVF